MTTPVLPPWKDPVHLPPRPAEGEYGYLDENDQPVAVDREKFFAVCAGANPPWYVWTPETSTCVPPTEVRELEPITSAREKQAALGLLRKGGVATLIGGAILFTLGDSGNALVVLILTLLFGVFPLLYGVFLFRRNQTADAADDRAKEARLEYWMEDQYAGITYALIGLLAMVFVGQMLAGLPASISQIGTSTETVRDGDWWRLLTAILAHGHIPHLIVNGYAIFYLGQRLEVLAGRERLLAVFLLAGLCGTVASYLLNDPQTFSVGASGGICGLLGFLFVLYARNRAHLSRSFSWPLILGSISLIGLGVVIPNIDNAGHVGGFIGGLVLGALLAPSLGQPNPPSPTLRAGGMASAAILLIGAAGALFALFT